MSDHKAHYISFLGTLNESVLDQSNFDLVHELDVIFQNEEDIRLILKNSKKGLKVFNDFINHIMQVEKNILSARVFFRERENIFSEFIPKAMRSQDYERLSDFKVNYKFIQWALEKSSVPKRKVIQKKFDLIIAARQRIVEQCMPLIINQARLHQVKSRKYNMDPMEFIQVASEGFLSAIDKFEPPADPKFKGVAIGWMKASLMAEFTETHLKFSLKEKRALYRANVATYRLKMTNFDDVYNYVHEQYPNFTKDYLKEIITASSIVHDTDGSYSNGDKVLLKETPSHEDSVMDNDESNILRQAMKELEIIEVKTIRLRGGVL